MRIWYHNQNAYCAEMYFPRFFFSHLFSIVIKTKTMIYLCATYAETIESLVKFLCRILRIRVSSSDIARVLDDDDAI